MVEWLDTDGGVGDAAYLTLEQFEKEGIRFGRGLMPWASGGGKMKHVSIVINPREAGLKPYRVSFHRPESMPVKSRLDEGIIYRHPECAETATVWGESEEAVADVLTTTKGGNEAT